MLTVYKGQAITCACCLRNAVFHFKGFFFSMSTVILVFPCILFLLQGNSVTKGW